MEIIAGKYIRKDDFHNSLQFKKIDRHINVCLALIEKLVKLNKECQDEVELKLKVKNYVIDYRVEQFNYYHEILAGIYYSCLSLKKVYEISTLMNFKNIDTTIGIALLTQQRFITFSAIFRMSSIFEFTHKEYEKNITAKYYFEKLKTKYPKLGESLELLKNFRNTMHKNGIWDKDKPLIYSLKSEQITIKKGDHFKIDNWTLYRIIHNCIELSKLMALDNKPNKLRETRFTNNGEKIVVLQIDSDFKKLL